MKKLLLTTAALLNFYALPANAMIYSYKVIDKNQAVVYATGDIMPNELDILKAWVISLPAKVKAYRMAAVILNSSGGSVQGAVDITGDILQMPDHPDTIVMNGSECDSACVLIWAAGARKYVGNDSRIGVHQAYSPNDPNGAFAVTAQVAQIYAKTGAPSSVVAAAVTTDHAAIHYLTASELAEWNVTVLDGFAKAEPSSNDTALPSADAPEERVRPVAPSKPKAHAPRSAQARPSKAQAPHDPIDDSPSVAYQKCFESAKQWEDSRAYDKCDARYGTR